MAEAPMHELLPWFLSGTLGDQEKAAFQAHLEQCADCREELAVLEGAQAELDRHGDALLEDHPQAQKLIATVRGELNGDEAVAVRRHLTLCAACAKEGRWILGAGGAEREAGRVTDNVVRSEAAKTAPVRSRTGALGWLVAAASLGALLITLGLREPSRGASGVLPHVVLSEGVERGDGTGARTVVLGEQDDRALLVLELYSEISFPVTLEIRDADAVVVHRDVGLGRRYGRDYLSVECSSTDCPPGRDYQVHVVSEVSPGQELVYRFKVTRHE